MAGFPRDPSDIHETFHIAPLSITGGSPTLTACTALYTNEVVSCSGDTVVMLTSGSTVFNTDLVPTVDDSLNVGLPTRRFRSLNSVRGRTTYWSATTSVTTPNLVLGLDSSGYTRTITANNSVIQDDCLNGGDY